MAIEAPTMTAAGGRAPDFVPIWVQVLIVLVAFGVLAWGAHRRNRR
jgi:hypothetical protein